MKASRYGVKKVNGGYVVMRSVAGKLLVDSGVIKDRDRAVQLAAQKTRETREEYKRAGQKYT